MIPRRTHDAQLTPCQPLGNAGAAGPVLALAWLADLQGREPVLALRYGPAPAASRQQSSAPSH